MSGPVWEAVTGSATARKYQLVEHNVPCLGFATRRPIMREAGKQRPPPVCEAKPALRCVEGR